MKPLLMQILKYFTEINNFFLITLVYIQNKKSGIDTEHNFCGR